MTRRHLLAVALAACLALTCTPGASGAAGGRPNFILVMADDQGYGDVAYNSPGTRLQTPVLDAMSRSALRFDRFYAAAPVCSPTRGGVMTGRHPNRFGCFQWGNTLRPQEITIAEALKDAGYTTGHFGKWHLGSGRAESPVSPGNSGFDHWVSAPNFFDNDPLLSHEGKVRQQEGESSMVTVEHALKFITAATKQSPDKPFLAVIWFGSPHNPHHGSPELRELYKDLPERQAHYFAEITGIDRAMGKLREQLRELGIADNTLLWYTSDNGPQGGGNNPLGSAGPFSGRKGELLEGGIRVPTIIEWPAVVKAGRATDVPCNSVDIYPTLIDIAGVQVRGQVMPLDGLSIRPLIEGAHFERDKPIGFWDYASPGVRSNAAVLLKEQHEGKPSSYDDATLSQITKQYDESDRSGEAAWMDGDWKLLALPPAAANKKNPGRSERTFALFNLKNDPAEKNDLAAKEPQRLEQMKQALEKWQAGVIRSLNGGDYPRPRN